MNKRTKEIQATDLYKKVYQQYISNHFTPETAAEAANKAYKAFHETMNKQHPSIWRQIKDF